MIRELNDLTAGLFLISGFAILRFRQVQDCFRSFLFQSFFPLQEFQSIGGGLPA